MMMTDLSGKVALVTGGTSGIEREVALGLAKLGAACVIVGRDTRKAEAIRQIAPTIQFIRADLSEMEQVRSVAGQFLASHDRLDWLIHCAGTHVNDRSLTADGIEGNFAANYLNKFLLTHLLLNTLRRSAPTRIIIIGSPYVFNPKWFLSLDGLVHRKPPLPFWSLTKAGMAVSVWTVELARRLTGSRVFVTNVIPGIVRTDILRNDPPLVRLVDRLLRPFVSLSAEEGARSPLYLATTDSPGGLYELFMKATKYGPVPASVPRGTYDTALAQQLWAFSERMVTPAEEPSTTNP